MIMVKRGHSPLDSLMLSSLGMAVNSAGHKIPGRLTVRMGGKSNRPTLRSIVTPAAWLQ